MDRCHRFRPWTGWEGAAHGRHETLALTIGGRDLTHAVVPKSEVHWMIDLVDVRDNLTGPKLPNPSHLAHLDGELRIPRILRERRADCLRADWIMLVVL